MPSIPPMAPDFNGTILIVEDDEAVRRFVARVLRSANYLVLDHPSGEAAVEFVRCHAGPIDLLIVDTVLPGINGIETADAIRCFRPALPVLQMSGYARTDIQRATETQAFHFIAKPFRPEQLSRAVHAIAGAPAALLREGAAS